MFANIFAFAIYGLIVYSVWGEGLPRLSLFAIYIFLPLFYAITLGRLTLWNLFGREFVIINTKSLSYRRNYGFFTTQLKVLPFKDLHYTIKERGQRSGVDSGTLQFAHHNEQGLSVNLFTTSVVLPIKRLQELTEQVRFIFALERISDPEYDVIHLN
ncbi:hypothetical protein GCM10023093_21600 [Nemorincola caseinilytica]|uniref:DUF304 domain-containing protein n=1 Tax=Nemorincola caseinilytica TaxID=2054315 RepID=A0ABP8NG93_9BACT